MKGAHKILIASFFPLLSGSSVYGSDVFFMRNQIRIYAAVKEGEKILVPLKKLPSRDEELVVFHGFQDMFYLRQVQQRPVMPSSLISPGPHYVFALAEGKWSDRRMSCLVAVGRGIKSAVKWHSGNASPGNFPTECMSPDPGFATIHLDVFSFRPEYSKFFYARSQILQSTFDRMTLKEKESGIAYKNVLGHVDKDGRCNVLAYNIADVDGMNHDSNSTPLGAYYGLVEFGSSPKLEKWLVLDSSGYEIRGYTFIKMPSASGQPEVKPYFLGQDGP